MRVEKKIIRESEIVRTPRLLQLEGLFDVQPDAKSVETWDLNFALPDQWNVGAIVGPSGSGKSTIAGELAAAFDERLIGGKDADGREIPPWNWPPDKCIADGFPASLGISDITGLLSSVGFSSPPAWRRPFRVLSNGQQFRANLARTLAEATVDGRPKFFDEYASLVHDQVAQIGSAAAAKTVRRHNLKFVAVTWRTDILDWLEPDWVLFCEQGGATRLVLNAQSPRPGRGLPPEGAAASRGSVRLPRGRSEWNHPDIALRIVRTDPSAWRLFRGHHYLSGDLHRSSKCFVGFVGKEPAVFTAVLPFPHAIKPGWREHRTVCLPDFQGIGCGNAMSEFIASLFAATGKPYMSTTSHPAMIRHRSRSPLWRMARRPSMSSARIGPQSNQQTGMAATVAADRLTAGFEYIGPARPQEAKRFGVLTGSRAA